MGSRKHENKNIHLLRLRFGGGIMIIAIKYPNGNLSINLNMFYPSTQRNSKKLMMLLYEHRYMNEKTYDDTVIYLNEQIEFWNRSTKTAANNWACFSKGSKRFKEYEKEYNYSARMVKLYTVSLRVLTEGK